MDGEKNMGKPLLFNVWFWGGFPHPFLGNLSLLIHGFHPREPRCAGSLNSAKVGWFPPCWRWFLWRIPPCLAAHNMSGPKKTGENMVKCLGYHRVTKDLHQMDGLGWFVFWNILVEILNQLRSDPAWTLRIYITVVQFCEAVPRILSFWFDRSEWARVK